MPYWIKSNTDKAREIDRLIQKDLSPWKQTCGLAGSSSRYDFCSGCYGNPDSNVVMVAEIPNFSHAFEKCPDELPKGRTYSLDEMWKMSWNFRGADQDLRIALKLAGFIPNQAEDKPWLWKCWLTDIVKCAEKDGRWKQMKRNGEAKEILLGRDNSPGSIDFLVKELNFISPKLIVLLGDQVESLYYQCDVYENVKALDIKARHYSRMQKPADKQRFISRFSKIANLMNIEPQ